jgi:hypothetical protein
MWSLSTKSQGHGPLQDHLGTLLDLFEPRQDILVEMAADGFDMEWFCFVSVESVGNIVLEVDILQRLGALPIELNLDIYG